MKPGVMRAFAAVLGLSGLMLLAAPQRTAEAGLISEVHLPQAGLAANTIEIAGLTTGQTYDLLVIDNRPEGPNAGNVRFKMSWTAAAPTFLLSDTAFDGWGWPINIVNLPHTLLGDTNAQGNFSLLGRRGVLLYSGDTGLSVGPNIHGQLFGNYAPGGSAITTLVDYLMLSNAGATLDWSVDHLPDRNTIDTTSSNAVAQVTVAAPDGAQAASSTGPHYLSGTLDDNARLPDGSGGTYALTPGLANPVMTPTAVPEPASAALLLAGLVCGWRRRLDRKK